MVPDSLSVIGGQFHRFRRVIRGGQALTFRIRVCEQGTIFGEAQLSSQSPACVLDKRICRVDFFQMGEFCQDQFSDKNLIPPDVLHLLGDGDEFACALPQGGKRQTKADAFTVGRANTVAFAVRAVITSDEAKFNEASDVPT